MCKWERLSPSGQAMLTDVQNGIQPPPHGIQRQTLYMLDDLGFVEYLPSESRWAITRSGESVFLEHAQCGNTAQMFHSGQRVKVLSWTVERGQHVAHWSADKVIHIDVQRGRVLLAGHGRQWCEPRFLCPTQQAVGV